MKLFIKILKKIKQIITGNLDFVYYKFLYKKPKVNNYEKKRFFLSNNQEKLSNEYRRIFPDKAGEKIAQADLYCEHIFDLLGSGPKKLSPEGTGYQTIDWHSDFKSGYRWAPGTFFRNIRYGHKGGVDIKVPWELSRFQHLPILGQAYILTGSLKYAQEFEAQITDWIKSNPVAFGVNWHCTMDVAIRVANWLVGMEYFSGYNFSQEFLTNFYTSIYEHGKFIRSHLEYSPRWTGNHYISDLAGLLFVAVYCSSFKESKKWQEFCIKELSNEIEKQVYPDGCDFEASTSYHRLVLELFFYSELLLRRNCEEPAEGPNRHCEERGARRNNLFSSAYQKRLKKMFEFSLYCIKPNGKIPQIGDNDSGRFLIFSKRQVLEHRYLLNLAAIYYKDSIFKLPESGFDEESFWVFGAGGRRIYDDLPFRQEPLKSKAFPDAGWYIMRHSNDYCFISCGPNGQNGNGGHAHNDKLSFELMLEGEDVIIDPGTYVYTPYPDWRNKFRGTAYHNTMQVDNIEQNDISKGLFGMAKNAELNCPEFKETGAEIIFKGRIRYLSHPIEHKRNITFNKKHRTLLIQDEVLSSGSHNISINFSLVAKASKYEFKSDKDLLKEFSGHYSEEYGRKKPVVFLKCILSLQNNLINNISILRKREVIDEAGLSEKGVGSRR